MSDRAEDIATGLVGSWANQPFTADDGRDLFALRAMIAEALQSHAAVARAQERHECLRRVTDVLSFD